MGTMTLVELRTELSLLLKDRGDEADDATRQNRWINWAYNHLSYPSIHPHRELQTRYDITLRNTVSGALLANEYSLSVATVGFQITGIRTMVHVAGTSFSYSTARRSLDPESIQWLDERTLTTGRPARYVIDGELLILGEIPGTAENNQILRVHCWREPTKLSADADVTVLPYYWDDVVLQGAKWRAERDLGYRELAQSTKEDYVDLINELNPRQELEAEDWGWEAPVVVQHAMEPPS